MTQQRKRYSTELKAKVALEAIRGHKTANEIASMYGVHPTQIAQWKKQVLDALPHFFSCAGYMGDPLGTLLVNLFNYMVLCRRNAY
jgi:Transposase